MIEHLNNFRRDVVLGFFTVFHHVDMNGFVVVGVELEDITKEDKNGWHKRLNVKQYFV